MERQPPEEFSGSLYAYFDEAAVSHLFRVSSGLDSASLGEPEVLGQVRHAWEVARNEEACGPVLSGAFRHALQVGKRARAETTAVRGTTSLSYAAVELATSVFGGLEGKQALVIGLGRSAREHGSGRLLTSRAPPVLVANRTKARATQLAESLGGQVAPWAGLGAALAKADVVACCTAGEGTLLSAALVGEALAQRPGRPMLLVDLAVPRHIDGAVPACPGSPC